MSNLMVSVSGIRGIIGEGLTPDVILNFARAFGTDLQGGKVVVGRDSRVSGDMLKNAVVAGLLSAGCDILDIGICPTPTTQLAVENLKAEGGVMITASHNPIMWNGLKLIGRDGLFLDAEEGERVVALSKSGEFKSAAWDELGVCVTYHKAIAEHLEAILNLPYIDVEHIRRRQFKVVVDCVCGAGSEMVPQLLAELGCVVSPLNCEATGLFPHSPEPLPENLTELCTAVREEQADLGIAVDPDSDRLALVSEKGEPLGEEKTLALAVKFMLGEKTGPVAINASTSRMSEDIAREFGVEVIRTKVGEINVAKKMREIGAVIGGEGNGGVILPDVHLGRDAPVGIALTLQHLLQSGGSLSALSDTLPHYEMVKDKVALTSVDTTGALEKIKKAYAKETLDFTDGIKIIRADSWIHVRASNTEPIIRVIAEAATKQEAQALCDELKEKVLN